MLIEFVNIDIKAERLESESHRLFIEDLLECDLAVQYRPEEGKENLN